MSVFKSLLVLLRDFWLLEEVGGRRLVVEVLCFIDDDVGGGEALGVDGVIRLEPEQQRLVDGDDLRRNLESDENS